MCGILSSTQQHPVRTRRRQATLPSSAQTVQGPSISAPTVQGGARTTGPGCSRGFLLVKISRVELASTLYHGAARLCDNRRSVLPFTPGGADSALCTRTTLPGLARRCPQVKISRVEVIPPRKRRGCAFVKQRESRRLHARRPAVLQFALAVWTVRAGRARQFLASLENFCRSRHLLAGVTTPGKPQTRNCGTQTWSQKAACESMPQSCVWHDEGNLWLVRGRSTQTRKRGVACEPLTIPHKRCGHATEPNAVRPRLKKTTRSPTRLFYL